MEAYSGRDLIKAGFFKGKIERKPSFKLRVCSGTKRDVLAVSFHLYRERGEGFVRESRQQFRMWMKKSGGRRCQTSSIARKRYRSCEPVSATVLSLDEDTRGEEGWLLHSQVLLGDSLEADRSCPLVLLIDMDQRYYTFFALEKDSNRYAWAWT